MEVTVNINGTSCTHDVEPRTLLVHFIREQAGLTGTNVGCDTSSCGACSVHLNGEAVKSCTVLAVQADGQEIRTIEGGDREEGPGRQPSQPLELCHLHTVWQPKGIVALSWRKHEPRRRELVAVQDAVVIGEHQHTTTGRVEGRR